MAVVGITCIHSVTCDLLYTLAIVHNNTIHVAIVYQLSIVPHKLFYLTTYMYMYMPFGLLALPYPSPSSHLLVLFLSFLQSLGL